MKLSPLSTKKQEYHKNKTLENCLFYIFMVVNYSDFTLAGINPQ